MAEVTVADSPLRNKREKLESTPADDAPLTQVGRYVILRKLGEGAMGEVYVAYDESLGRRVAIKLVRSMGQRAGDVYARMLREAQGLARLSHPNVVQVYEAGVFKGRVFVAMEYIEGESLREWVAREKRSWREILRCCIEAGRGLAAAHEVGLVHRDYKPDNVIVGADGRVRVLDFGLVRAESEGNESDELISGATGTAPFSVSALGSLQSELTQAHTLIGTPAYMSPEQHLRETADARSDVFAFAIVLYEMLYGVRPFAGDDQAKIMNAVLKQRLSEPLEGRRIPAWLRRTLLRGLAIDPGARFATMTDFIVALSKDPAKRRRRWLLGIAFGGVLAVAVGLVVNAIRADAEACSGGAEGMSTVWDEARREALTVAFAATGLAYSGDVSARVVERLGDYREAWIYSYREACLAHRRGERSSEILDLQMACLRSRRREFDAIVRTFVNADADVVERAVSVVAELTEHGDLRLCDDLEYLRRGASRTLEPAVAVRLEELRGEVADAAALGRAGKNTEGLAALERLQGPVAAVDEPMLEVEVGLERGRLLLGEGDYEAADESLVKAYYEARAIGHDEVAAAATIELLKIVTVTQAAPERAEIWIKQAEAEVRLLGRQLVVADFHAARAGLYTVQGAFDRALDDVEEALRIRKRELRANHPKIAAALRGKGAALFKRGRNAEARASLREALAIVEVALGPHHPDNADVLTKLALVAAHEGRFADGIEIAGRALEISERARGPDHPDNATILSNLGELEIQNGDYRAAMRHLERAVAIASSVYGDSSVKSMLYVSSLAVARYKLGDIEGAEGLMERAYMIADASLGADHPSTGALRGNLGEVLNDLGRFAEAEAHLKPAVVVLRAGLGPDRPEIGPVQRELARALFGLGRRAEAEIEARGALALCGGGTIAADELAKIHLLLARIVLADPDRGEQGVLEARGFVEMAGRDLAGHEANDASLVAEQRALLRAVERARRADRGP